MIPAFSLRNGAQLPAIGLGFWKVPPQDCPQLVTDAVRAGYRHFDCACDYGNEAEVGIGIQRAITSGLVRREDLWITSKLWNTYHRPEHVEAACKKSLVDLRLDQLDLYLVHFPIAQRFVPFEERYPPGWFFDPNAAQPKMEFDPVPQAATWQAMIDLRRRGLVKNIGVCNFSTDLLRDLIHSSSEPPSVLQVELHPYLTQEKLLRFAREQQIAVTAFSPFAALSYHVLEMAERSDTLLEHPLIRGIAADRGRTPAQVLLRWGVQRGTAVVPKTVRVERLAENLAIFDFELTSEQMSAISGLNQNRRYNDPGVFCELAFRTFCPIYE